MLSEQTKRDLIGFVKGKILFDEPMKNHTSFRIGGPADALVIPKDEVDLKNLLTFINKNAVALTVIGNGTKLLVGDKGVEGIIVKVRNCFDDITISGFKVKVGAGYLLAKLSALAADYGLSGLEFAIGIPGTVGGGVVMNAGAHGSTMSDVVTSARAISLEGQLEKYSKNNLEFRHRRSRFQDNKEIVLSVEMKLKKDKVEEIKKKMYECIEWRKKNQPLNLPNAGSIFKNPMHIPAGKLIDMAGLKGMRIGNAKISEKHANFIVNLGNATANDVLRLIDTAQKTVLRKYSVKLKLEIRIIGRFRENS